MKLIAIFIAFAVLSACSGQTIEPEQITNTRTYAYKSIAGVSMGGGAAAYLGFSQPEKWDSIGILGAPLVDQTSMNRMIKRNWLGGFCSYETIQEFMAQGKDLNSEETFCGIYTEQSSTNRWPNALWC